MGDNPKLLFQMNKILSIIFFHIFNYYDDHCSCFLSSLLFLSPSKSCEFVLKNTGSGGWRYFIPFSFICSINHRMNAAVN